MGDTGIERDTTAPQSGVKSAAPQQFVMAYTWSILLFIIENLNFLHKEAKKLVILKKKSVSKILQE